MALLKQTDWNGTEIPHTTAEITRYEARVARVRGEVGEIRTAVRAMREEGGAFLDREALLLDRANEADGPVDLAWPTGTRERRDYVPTSARSALLIARAFSRTHPADTGRD
ncbi:hypothetical protein [Streptosporangium canum]|uniref:hypothetical protein n=1 Tax=Streptosporangium canum TaxID=324952 RepID=UPI0037BDD7CC